MCRFKQERSEKADPNTSQENGFAPVCVHIWLFKLGCCENVDPHTSQKIFFSSVFACVFLNWHIL